MPAPLRATLYGLPDGPCFSLRLLFLVRLFLVLPPHANQAPIAPGHNSLVPFKIVLYPVAGLGEGASPLTRTLQAIDLLSIFERFGFHLRRHHALERGVDRRQWIGFVIFEREAHVLERV